MKAYKYNHKPSIENQRAFDAVVKGQITFTEYDARGNGVFTMTYYNQSTTQAYKRFLADAKAHKHTLSKGCLVEVKTNVYSAGSFAVDL